MSAQGWRGKAPTSPQRVRHADRQARALALRIEGRSSVQIATELGISRGTAWRLVNGALKDRREEIAERADDLRAIESEKLDAAAVAIWPAVMEGDLRAQVVWIKNRGRFADLLGLDMKQPTPEQAGAVFNIVTAYPWERPGHPGYKDEDVIDGVVIDALALTPGEEDAGAQMVPDGGEVAS